MKTPEIVAELQRRLDPKPRTRTITNCPTPFNIVEHVPEIICADGLQFSMQASRSHYCTPRDDFGPWSAVEFGFPNRRVSSWMEFAEDKSDPTGTVYGWVPLARVATVIKRHGGFKT